MKRFFFRSSGSSNTKNNHVTDKQEYREDESTKDEYSLQSPFKSSHFKNPSSASGNDCLEAIPALRRCHSFSSGAFPGHDFCESSDPSDSPSSSGGSLQTHNYNHTRHHPRTPEKHMKSKRLEKVYFENCYRSGSASGLCDSSRNSSTSSSNESSKVLDLYIDGEQQRESTQKKGKTCNTSYLGKGRGKRPPRVQSTAPSSPTGTVPKKSIFSSVKCSRGMLQYFSPMDSVENEVEHDLSHDLAKRVVEKLSKSQLKTRDSDVPMSIEDIYAGSLDGFAQKVCCPNESENVHMFKDCYGFDQNDGGFNTVTVDDFDAKLRSKLREVEKKICSFSSELEQDCFIGHVPEEELVHKIRSLMEEKTSLAIDASSALRNHIDERLSIKEEFNSRLRKLEMEKNQLQSTLEKELDRRSSDWSYKLEKFQEEEQRLRQRAKDLAEQNVSLQREVSSLSEKDKERSEMMVYSDEQAKELSAALEATNKENQELRRHICELQENYKVTKEERDCLRRNFQAKDDECKDLHRSVTRLLRTCSEQEKTIEGLQGIVESVEKKQTQPLDSFEKHMHKLQIEQLRLVGVEQALRREVESFKNETLSLRNENINLLNRLKCCGNDGGSFTLKLDQELSARLRCLQTQGLSLLGQSTNLCSQLLEHVKGKDGSQAKASNLDGQFIVDCDVKIQGLRRGTESMSRSLQTVSDAFHEKSVLSSESQNQDNDGFRQTNQQLQDMTTCKLKAEMLLTNLLQEKLYAKELEVEQLQAELATAVRGNDVIRCQLQNALDNVSSTTHQMKGNELQMLKYAEKINQLETDLEGCTKELAVTKGILPKVTEERDSMWKQVKQCSENNMLLNSEVFSLKKRIEGLEEDLLLKEGQITILKDSIGKPFDLLSGSDHTEEFELE